MQRVFSRPDRLSSLLRRGFLLLRRWYRHLFVALSIFFFFDLIYVLHSTTPSTPLNKVHGRGPNNQKIYIASLHWNGEDLIRQHWAPGVLKLVKYLGKDNVYISIGESGSWDNAKDALRELDAQLGELGVERWVDLRNLTHTDEVSRVPQEGEEGWVWTNRGKKELRRIPWLAGLRNRAMGPLREMEKKGRKFDKVLWLNDVIFNTEDVATLIETRNGDYSAACSLDFSAPPWLGRFYDTFALRDIEGAEAITMTWPYFLPSRSLEIMKNNEPTPVKACWNGIVAFDAAPFYGPEGLKFRGLPDSLAETHLEASECCLIHADNPLSDQKGVWLNPNVRVGYNIEAYKGVHRGSWPSWWGRYLDIFRLRWVRWTGGIGRWLARGVVERRIDIWEKKGGAVGENDRREKGRFCAVDEMQIVLENGWMHV